MGKVDIPDISRKGGVEPETKASLPEWSKGVVLRTNMRKRAWVRTPQLASIFVQKWQKNNQYITHF